MILVFPSVFKVVPQMAVRSLYGDACRDALNSCSILLYSSLLDKEYVDREDMASCHRPRNVSLSFPLCPY